jgi:hypothetical protein
MAQLFHRSANTIAKVSIVGGVILLASLGGIAHTVDQSPYTTNQSIIREQPVPFSHEHHVKGLGIDCRYCHTSVEESHFAGIPPTKTCMTCHSQIWTNTEVLRPVRESWRTNTPIEWTRVHNLPDFAYFNHGIHVAKGVGCSTCHGPVDRMPLMWQHASLTMSWCLECHRRAGEVRPAPRADLQPRVPGRPGRDAVRQDAGGGRAEAGRAVQHPQGPTDELQHVPPVTRPPLAASQATWPRA